MKILEYYNYFTITELKRLTLFLESSYFNNEISVLTLHTVIFNLKQSSKSPIEDLNFQTIHASVFPGKTYNESYLRVVLSKLIKQIERFIEVEYCEMPFYKRIEMLQRFGLKKNYEGAINKSLDTKPSDFKDELYYLSKSFLYEDYNAYLYSSLGDHVNQYKENIIKFNEHFDTFFIYNKLKSYCNLFNDQKILNTNYEVTYKEELNKVIYSEKYDDIIPIKIYKLLYRLLNNEDEYYIEFVALLKQTSSLFPYEEVLTFFAHAQNICARKINESKLEYFNELFLLFKYRIENNLILSNGEIQPRTYKSIVNTGLRVKEIKWTYDFMVNFAKFLPKDEYDKAYHFNMAFYNFEIKNYSQTIELLSKVEYDDLFYGFNVRLLLVKSYFELDEMEPLDHLLASFKIFINRKKGISDYYKEAHHNTIYILKKMIDVNPRDKKKIAEIGKKMVSLKPIAEIAWLKEKMKELGWEYENIAE